MDQNKYISERWGELTFFPAKTNLVKDTCLHCLLKRSDECQTAPCASYQREDNREGYFSTQQMPEEFLPAAVDTLNLRSKMCF